MVKLKWVHLTDSIAIFVFWATVACNAQPTVQAEPVPNEPTIQQSETLPVFEMNERLSQARDDLEEQLIDTPGVVGVAIGASGGEPELIVFIEQLTPELRNAIPPEFDGIAVRVEFSGQFTAPPPGDANDDVSVLPANGLNSSGTPESNDALLPPGELNLGEIGDAMNELASQLMNMEGVSGVGIGDCNGNDCIVVFVENLTPELQNAIPAEINGFTVRVETGGPFTTQ